jgi:hypothetical protein
MILRAFRPMMAFLLILLLAVHGAVPQASAYVFNRTVSASGGCPQPDRQHFDASTRIDRRWSTSFSTSVQNVFTQDTTPIGRITEIHTAIENSFAVWAGVGTALNSTSFDFLQQTVSSDCDSFDGLNMICFNDEPGAFATGVLAFTRNNVADRLPYSAGAKSAVFVGQILDSDILFRPGDSSSTFATRNALPQNPGRYDLESVLTHEIGHMLGFSHSSVVRAMMYPFAPPRGTFTGTRCPSPPGAPCDLPLADDDRAGLRVLYPNPSDPNVGVISGRVLPANPISNLSAPQPVPGPPTGIFGAHVVALDAQTGAVVAGTVGGWSCNAANPQPVSFDGTYVIGGLPVNRNYKLYVEPLDDPTRAVHIELALRGICGSNPAICSVPKDSSNNPVVNTNFVTTVKP